MLWYHFLCFIDHCIVCPSIQLCVDIICCALLTIVLSVPLYGYDLVSCVVLYWPLYCLSLYTAMFWYHLLALLAIVISVPLYDYVLVLFFCALLTIVLSVPLYDYVLVSFFGFIGHCIVCPSIRLCFGIIVCALLAIVLSVPLYGYALVSFFCA